MSKKRYFRNNEDDELSTISSMCHLPKHLGKFWTQVLEEDRPYMEWLVSGDPDFELDKGLYEYLMDLLED